MFVLLDFCFEKVFEHEVDNTKEIYKIVKMSLSEEDWATSNFLQWFVKEQVEENGKQNHTKYEGLL